MKLQTRQEIVDGVKGEMIYRISHILVDTKFNKGDDGSVYETHSAVFTKPEAEELYELLKEKFERKKCVCSKLLSKTGIHVENCPIIN